MKKLFILLTAAAIVAAVSCEKEIVPDVIEEPSPEQEETQTLKNPITITFTAEALTKVSLSDESAGENKTAVWDENDQIKIVWWDSSTNTICSAPATPTAESHGSYSTTFTASVEDADYYYAVYPSSLEVSMTDENSLSVSFENDADCPTSFSGAAYYAAKTTKAEKSFEFHPISTIIKFQVEDAGASKIYFRSLNGKLTQLRGSVPVTFNESFEITAIGGASGSANISKTISGDGWYYLPLPASGQTAGGHETFSNGFLLQMTKSSTECPAAYWTNAITLTPGKMYKLGTSVDDKAYNAYYVSPIAETGTGTGRTIESPINMGELAAMVPFTDATEAASRIINNATIYLLGSETAYTAAIPASTGINISHSYSIIGGLNDKTTTLTTDSATTFSNAKATVSMQNITFSGCTARAIVIGKEDNVGGGTISISNCHFNNNNSGSGNSGGAVYIYGGSGTEATFTTCEFDNNSAVSGRNGGGVVVTNSKTKATFNNCTFTLNNVSGGAGSGGAIFANNGFTYLNNCTFGGSTEAKNEAKYGAAIDIPNANGKVYARGCSFIANNGTVVVAKGGAISVNKGLIYLDKCYFKDNTFTKPASSNTSSLGFDIGAFDDASGVVCMHNCTVNNSLIGEGNTTNGASVQSKGQLLIVNSTFVGSGSSNRGCVAVGYNGTTDGDQNKFILCNCTFTHESKISIWCNSASYSFLSDYCLIKSQTLAKSATIISGSHNAVGAFTMGSERGDGYFNPPTLPAGYTAPTKEEIEAIVTNHPQWESFSAWLGEEWGKDQAGSPRGEGSWTPGSIQQAAN